MEQQKQTQYFVKIVEKGVYFVKRITAFTAIFALTISLVMSVSACGRSYTVRNEDDAADFLESCGVEVTGDCTIKEVTIPSQFGDVYEQYNELQKQQGFDLSRYRSREAEVYTFSVVSVDGSHTDFTEAHVMVCDGSVIGGDLSSPALDGGMEPLIR